MFRLPTKLWMKIAGYLPFYDLLNLSLVKEGFSVVLTDPDLLLSAISKQRTRTSLFYFTVGKLMKDFPKVYKELILHLACSQNDALLALTLNDCSTALKYAYEKGNPDFFKEIIRCTGSVIESQQYFYKACRDGKFEFVRMLIDDPGIDPSYSKNKALQTACKKGHEHIVQMLLDCPRLKMNNSTIDMEEIMYSSLSIVEMLLNDGRLVFTFECFVIACVKNRVELVELLLERTPLNFLQLSIARTIAKTYEYDELLELLCEYGISFYE
jgi:hypothetical protein